MQTLIFVEYIRRFAVAMAPTELKSMANLENFHRQNHKIIDYFIATVPFFIVFQAPFQADYKLYIYKLQHQIFMLKSSKPKSNPFQQPNPFIYIPPAFAFQSDGLDPASKNQHKNNDSFSKKINPFHGPHLYKDKLFLQKKKNELKASKVSSDFEKYINRSRNDQKKGNNNQQIQQKEYINNPFHKKHLLVDRDRIKEQVQTDMILADFKIKKEKSPHHDKHHHYNSYHHDKHQKDNHHNSNTNDHYNPHHDYNNHHDTHHHDYNHNPYLSGPYHKPHHNLHKHPSKGEIYQPYQSHNPYDSPDYDNDYKKPNYEDQPYDHNHHHHLPNDTPIHQLKPTSPSRQRKPDPKANKEISLRGKKFFLNNIGIL